MSDIEEASRSTDLRANYAETKRLTVESQDAIVWSSARLRKSQDCMDKADQDNIRFRMQLTEWRRLLDQFRS